MSRTIHAADAFCGAGGTSTGLALACRDLGADLDLLAINHWKVAVETHSTSEPLPSVTSHGAGGSLLSTPVKAGLGSLSGGGEAVA